MTTGYCEPRQAGSQDTRVETARRSQTLARGVVRSRLITHTPEACGYPAQKAGEANGQRKDRPTDKTRQGSGRGPAEHHEDTTGQPTGRGRRTPSLDPYLITVSYPAANPAQTPTVTGLPSVPRPPPSPVSRPTCARRPHTPPPMPHFAWPSRLRAFSRSGSRRGKHRSRRTNRPLRPRPGSSFQPGW